MNMKLKPILNELNAELRKELEIIYKDKDLMVIMPRSQKLSKMLGRNAQWCQRGKTGFEMWSRVGLLIRFLMRGGRKIRFTYFFKDMRFGDHPKGTYYWANETGHHVLKGDGDPFDPPPKDPNNIRSLEKDIIDQISKIPEEAREKVREFIEIYKDGYEYCYRDNEYRTKREIEVDSIQTMIDAYYSSVEDAFNVKPEYNLTFIKEMKGFSVYLFDMTSKSHEPYSEKHFDDFKEAKSFVIKMLTQYWEHHKNKFKEK